MTSTLTFASLENVKPVAGFNGSIDTQLQADYAISLTDGLICPATAKPVLVTKHPSFRIEDVEEIQRDPTRGDAFLSKHAPLDPVFLANIDEAVMNATGVISGRSSMRSLMSIVSPVDPKAYYSKRKSFVLIAEKIGSQIILMQKTGYEESAGGFGQGFNDVLTASSDRRVDISAMHYFRVVSYTIENKSFLVSHEVDCLDGETSVELKSRKIKRNKHTGNPYPLGYDFYVNVWRQMVLSGTNVLKIGLHEDGKVKALPTMNLEQVREEAGISVREANLCFAKLVKVLSWVSDNLRDGQQAEIEYVVDTENLSLFIIPEAEHVRCLSESVRATMVAPKTDACVASDEVDSIAEALELSLRINERSHAGPGAL